MVAKWGLATGAITPLMMGLIALVFLFSAAVEKCRSIALIKHRRYDANKGNIVCAARPVRFYGAAMT
jgi:hypothetical protein